MENQKISLNLLPQQPGVYIFKDNQGEVLYVGKAINLRRRVSQYFQRDDAIGEKTNALVGKITAIETIKTANEFDALLLEAKLIHDWQPYYNSLSKDDKSPIYIVLTTNEKLPHVQFCRKSNLPKAAKKGPTIFGPFASSRQTRELLRRCRRIIPFCTQKERNGKPCFYTHLQLCKPCPSVIAKMPLGKSQQNQVKIYRRNIIRLKDLLSGKGKNVRRELGKEMHEAADRKLFEEAQLIKEQLQCLSGIESARFEPDLYLTHEHLAQDIKENELSSLTNILRPYYPHLSTLNRIECVDISNLSGSLSTGSLVVLTHGLIDKKEYRKFHIRREKAPNDPAMIAEVINRRLMHKEWPLPDLLVVDGGKSQIAAAKHEIKDSIPVIGLAKRFEEIVVSTDFGFKLIRIAPTAPAIHLLQRLRDEAHRFAKSYHLLLRNKALLESRCQLTSQSSHCVTSH